MAVESSGGGTPIQTGGVVQASGGAEGSVIITPAATSFASDTPEGIAQAAADKLAYDKEHGGGAPVEEVAPKDGEAPPAKTGDETAPKADAEEPVVYKTMAEVPAERVEAIKTNLKAAGGLFADPRYEAAALEFESLGSITDATKASTAAAFNVPVEAIDQFVAGQVAQRQLAAAQPKGAAQGEPTAADVALGQEVLKAFPGATTEADYSAFMAWGKDNLTAPEKAAYDGALNRGDAATTGILLESFKAKYSAAGHGPGPRDITQEGQASTSNTAPQVQGFKSSDEMTKAMSDPRYRTDPAYNAEVAARVAASRY